MVTGPLFMTKEETYSKIENSASEYHKLSIQVSLSGLSFCVLDIIGNNILTSENIVFEKELTPYDVLKHLKDILEKNEIKKVSFSEIVVIHRNNLFSLVPKALFDEKELANYLKFNAKILANDLIAYDELEGYDIVNVYVPFVNINNYIYDLFGEFEFKHNGTVLIQTLLNSQSNGNEPVCFVNVLDNQMDITVVNHKKLILYNNYNFATREDFIYYLLFTLEQLKLDTATIMLKLFGAIEEGDPIYNICYHYIKHIAIFIPSHASYPNGYQSKDTIDFAVLNSL